VFVGAAGGAPGGVVGVATSSAGDVGDTVDPGRHAPATKISTKPATSNTYGLFLAIIMFL
jgi:hypothetical protein